MNFQTFISTISTTYFSTRAESDHVMDRYDTADFLVSKTSGSFQVNFETKSENPIGKYEVFFEQVLDNLELSEPLDLAFILIQVFY